MPLLQTTPTSIGSTVFLTSTGEDDGVPCFVRWPDRGKRQTRLRSVRRAWDTTAVLFTVTNNRRGPVTLLIPWCPSALYEIIKTAFADGGIQTATIFHPLTPSGEVLAVEWRAVEWNDDGQYADGDPIEDLTIRLWSHGAP